MISDFNIAPTFSSNINNKCGIGFQPSFNLGNGSFGGKIGIYFMDFWQSFEIDSPKDWQFVSLLFENYLGKYYKL